MTLTLVTRFKCHCQLFQEELGDIGQDLGLGAPAQDPAAVPDAGDVLGSEEDVSLSNISPTSLLFPFSSLHMQ